MLPLRPGRAPAYGQGGSGQTSETCASGEARRIRTCPLSPSWRQAVAESFAEDMRQIDIGVDLQLVPSEFFFGSGPEPGILAHRAFVVSEFASDAALATPACERYHSANIPSEANGW